MDIALPSNNVLVRGGGGGVALSAIGAVDLGALGSESTVPALPLVVFLAGALATFVRFSAAVRETEAAVGVGESEMTGGVGSMVRLGETVG